MAARIAPSPTFSAALWIGVGVAAIAAVGTVALAIAGRAAAAAATFAMLYATLTVAGRRWSA